MISNQLNLTEVLSCWKSAVVALSNKVQQAQLDWNLPQWVRNSIVVALSEFNKLISESEVYHSVLAYCCTFFTAKGDIIGTVLLPSRLSISDRLSSLHQQTVFHLFVPTTDLAIGQSVFYRLLKRHTALCENVKMNVHTLSQNQRSHSISNTERSTGSYPLCKVSLFYAVTFITRADLQLLQTMYSIVCVLVEEIFRSLKIN
jgi:hypothetical protein